MQNGTTAWDEASALAVGTDGSIFLGGGTYGDWNAVIAGDADFAAIKLDADGAQVWKWQVMDQQSFSALRIKILTCAAASFDGRWCLWMALTSRSGFRFQQCGLECCNNPMFHGCSRAIVERTRKCNVRTQEQPYPRTRTFPPHIVLHSCCFAMAGMRAQTKAFREVHSPRGDLQL